MNLTHEDAAIIAHSHGRIRVAQYSADEARRLAAVRHRWEVCGITANFWRWHSAMSVPPVIRILEATA